MYFFLCPFPIQPTPSVLGESDQESWYDLWHPQGWHGWLVSFRRSSVRHGSVLCLRATAQQEFTGKQASLCKGYPCIQGICLTVSLTHTCLILLKVANTFLFWKWVFFLHHFFLYLFILVFEIKIFAHSL